MKKIILASAAILLVVMGVVIYIGNDGSLKKSETNIGTVMFYDEAHQSGYIVLEQSATDSFISIKELAENVHEQDKVEFSLSKSGEALNVKLKR